MRALVVDCSVTSGWVIPSQSNEYSSAVLERLSATKAFVPGIWIYETANTLLSAERRKKITREDSTDFFKLIKSLPMEIIHKNDGEWSELLLWMGNTHRLSVYDTAYLYLAMDRGYTLATRDKQLALAASAAGVEVFQS